MPDALCINTFTTHARVQEVAFSLWAHPKLTRSRRKPSHLVNNHVERHPFSTQPMVSVLEDETIGRIATVHGKIRA